MDMDPSTGHEERSGTYTPKWIKDGEPYGLWGVGLPATGSPSTTVLRLLPPTILPFLAMRSLRRAQYCVPASWPKLGRVVPSGAHEMLTSLARPAHIQASFYLSMGG